MLCYAIVVARFQFPVLFGVLAFVAHSQCDATVSLAFILKVDIKNASCVRETVVPCGEVNRLSIGKDGVLGMLRNWPVSQVVLWTRVLLGVYQELVPQRHRHRVSHVSSTNLLQGVSQGGGTVEHGCVGDAVC